MASSSFGGNDTCMVLNLLFILEGVHLNTHFSTGHPHLSLNHCCSKDSWDHHHYSVYWATMFYDIPSCHQEENFFSSLSYINCTEAAQCAVRYSVASAGGHLSLQTSRLGDYNSYTPIVQSPLLESLSKTLCYTDTIDVSKIIIII